MNTLPYARYYRLMGKHTGQKSLPRAEGRRAALRAVHEKLLSFLSGKPGLTETPNDPISLGPSERMTVSDCLEFCVTEHTNFGRGGEEYSDIIILAYRDNDLVVRTSRMQRKDALWMLMSAMDHVRGG